MALKARVESLGDVDERHRAFYIAADGGYVLDVDDMEDHPAVAPLANAHQRQIALGSERQRELDALHARVPPEDFTVEEWERLKALDAAREPDREARDRVLDAELDRHRKWIDHHCITVELRDALLNVGCRPALLNAAIALLRDRVAVFNRDGDEMPVIRTRAAKLRVDMFIRRWSRTPEGQEFITQKRPEPVDGFASLIKAMK